MAELQPSVQELMPYMDTVAPCLYEAEDESAAQACIGVAARACMDAESRNQTTVEMMFCFMAEREAWDRLLNAEYASTMDGMRRLDPQEVEHFPQFANRADSLRTAQRAWIALRDADYTLEYAMWGSGSMRQIAVSGCRMRRRAERTIYLKFLGDYMR